MTRDPYGRAGERYIEYLEERERRVGKPKREHELGLLLKDEEVSTAGALKEREIIEAAAGRRLGREQEFARPLQRAEVGRVGAVTGLRGAEAEKVRYGTEFEKGLESTIEDIVGLKRRMGVAKTEEAEMGISEERRRIRLRDEAEEEAARSLDVEEEVPTVAAKPVEGIRSLARKTLGFTLPGLTASSLMNWLRRSKKEEEYAYPGAK